MQVCDCTVAFSPPYVVVQDTPPFAASVDCVNVRVWLPPPHVREQPPQPLHEPTQFTGHNAALQVCDCTAAFSPPYVEVQDTPPNAAAVD